LGQSQEPFNSISVNEETDEIDYHDVKKTYDFSGVYPDMKQVFLSAAFKEQSTTILSNPLIKKFLFGQDKEVGSLTFYTTKYFKEGVKRQLFEINSAFKNFIGIIMPMHDPCRTESDAATFKMFDIKLTAGGVAK